MSAITEFFNGIGTDHCGCTLQNIIDMEDAQLETSHDIVQWTFPLHESSDHFKRAPFMTQEDVNQLSSNNVAQANLLKCLERFENFFGIRPYDKNKIDMWCYNRNHNLLRITRIIRSLRLFGLQERAKDFYNRVLQICEGRNISEVSKEFWKRALEGPVTQTLKSK